MNPYDMPQSLTAAVRYFADEQVCHDFLAGIRWPKGVRCPSCDSASIGALTVIKVKSRSKNPKAVPTVRRLWTCKECRRQFTVKAGTIFEESALSLTLWLPAVWMIVSAKNGISSCELARHLDVSQKSAWFMLHRIREAMRDEGSLFKGKIEADETFMGGVAGNMHRKRRKELGIKKGDYSRMTPVLGIIQRASGNEPSKIKLHMVKNTRRSTILPHILAKVEHGSSIYTDKHSAYFGLHESYDHQTVDHAIEYVKGTVHTNGLENFWSVLKRTVGGTYVAISNKHIARYLDEQAARFNERTKSDLGRFLATLRRVTGRRLTFAELTAEPDGEAQPA